MPTATEQLEKLNKERTVVEKTDTTPLIVRPTEKLRETVKHKEAVKASKSSEQSADEIESRRLTLEHKRLTNRLAEIRLAKAEARDNPDAMASLEEEEQEKQSRVDAILGTLNDKTVQGKAASVIHDVANKTVDTANRISTLKTVGGIGLLIVVLAILLFIVVQVNAEGDTRLKQLWAMINGKAALIGHVDIVRQSQTYAGGDAAVYGANASSMNGGPNDTLAKSTGGILQRHDNIIPTPFGTIDIPDFRLNF